MPQNASKYLKSASKSLKIPQNTSKSLIEEKNKLSGSLLPEIETFALCGVDSMIALPPSSAIYSPEKNTLPDAVDSIFIDDSRRAS